MPINLKHVDASSVPTPPIGQFELYIDSSDVLMQKDSTGATSPAVVVPTQPGNTGTVTGVPSIINVAALKAYTGTATGLLLFCYSQAGIGGGWLTLIAGDTATVADNGMSFRDGSNRLWKRPAETPVTPQLFGAIMDTSTNDAPAIKAAAAYCANVGCTLNMLAGPKYLWTDSDNPVIMARHIAGQMAGVDEPSSGIYYVPNLGTVNGKPDILSDSTKDMVGCLNMGAPGFLVENLTIEGNGAGDISVGGYVTKALLPKYSAFAPGLTAFSAQNGATGKFRNCSTARIKVGLYLNSTDGHVFWDDCDWKGWFTGVYCKKNSGDYFGFGGGCQGGWAGITFGNTLWAGHYGGMEGSFLRCHLGFSPYAMYQVDDSPDDTTGILVGGFSGKLMSVSFEEVGERAIKVLPNSVTAITLDRGVTAFAPSSDPAYRLPAALVPDVGAQQYWMEFGILTQFESDTAAFDVSPYTTAPNAAALFVNAIQPAVGAKVDLSCFSSIVHGTNDGSQGMPAGYYPKSNDAYINQRRGTVLAIKDDRRLNAAVLPVANLLPNPEQITQALGVANNALAANGGNIQPYQNTATINTLTGWNGLSTPEFTGFTFPRGFYEELGANPRILKVTNASGFTDCGIQLYLTQPTDLTRLIFMSFWAAVKGPAAGQTISSRFYLGDNAGNNVFDTTEYFDTPLVWRRFRWNSNRNSTGTYNKWNASIHNLLAQSGAMYIAGLMCNWDEAAPYNRNPGPTLNGPVFFDGASTVTAAGATGTATAPPAKPAVWVVEYINGVKYVSPKYTAA